MLLDAFLQFVGMTDVVGLVSALEQVHPKAHHAFTLPDAAIEMQLARGEGRASILRDASGQVLRDGATSRASSG
jgi:hypothetical protein